MPQIKGTILAEDIKNNSYFNTGTCPITRALQRAGYTFFDYGVHIGDEHDDNVVNESNIQYREMRNRVLRMYARPVIGEQQEEPKDFDFVIDY